VSPLRTSVLIPSFGRPEKLSNCLRSLARQTMAPDEVLVVWQAEDTATRDAALSLVDQTPFSLKVLHSPEQGVVPAENAALDAAAGDVILLIDDDAVSSPDWVARHLAHYADPAVGAVGGPADNFLADGTPFPRRAVEPLGKLTSSGRLLGNMYDQIVEWRSRPPQPVDHLVGYNMSLRRVAFDRFEAGLKRYWQLFELDACLQVRERGYQILFDHANVVAHHPTNPAYAPGREGDLTVRVYNAAYNHAFVLARHSSLWLRPVRLAFLLLVGSTGTPGLLGCLAGIRRYGQPCRELRILLRTLRSSLAGWLAGARARRASQCLDFASC
jgi:GT2 family glycosyltransferase